MPEEAALSHFAKRAEGYNRSARWVQDEVLIERIRAWAEAGPEAEVLDLATGTGMLAASFRGKVRRVVGFDLSPEMTRRGPDAWDQLVIGAAELLPFADASFDACVCRQGLQFMELDRALPQIRRVLRPGGRAVFCHLTAYGETDKEDAFRIQKLRNPARRNFFLPDDIPGLLRDHGFAAVEAADYFSRESVAQWSDHGAIGAERMAGIREAYRDASAEFRRLHEVEFQDRDILETMKLVLVRGRK
jgi:SAM-dependent methyltransferase